MAEIKVIVKFQDTEDKDAWVEQYHCNEHPEAWAQSMIDNFNNTLRPGEKARELVRVEVAEGAESTKRHVWGKVNLVTLQHKGVYYDKVKCHHCEVTGKRYGADSVRRDSKYKAKKWETCKG